MVMDRTSNTAGLCPTCGVGGAYQGFSVVQCLNARCIHYDADYFLETMRTELAQGLEADLSWQSAFAWY